MMAADEAARVMTCQPADLARRVVETHVAFLPDAPPAAIFQSWCGCLAEFAAELRPHERARLAALGEAATDAEVDDRICMQLLAVTDELADLIRFTGVGTAGNA